MIFIYVNYVDTGNVVIDELNKKSKAIELVRLNKLVSQLPEIQEDLEIFKEETKTLRFRASQLSDGLRGVKRELLTQLSKCNTAECKNIKSQYEIGRLDSNGIDYNQVRFIEKTFKKNILWMSFFFILKFILETYHDMTHHLYNFNFSSSFFFFFMLLCTSSINS